MTKSTILVVDDSATIRKIIERELIGAGYEVLAAANGMEAMAMLEWADPLPDLMTLDIDMPVMNGFEVCQRIRDAAETGPAYKQRIAQIPIVLVSSNDTFDDREKGYRLGIIDFISKPFAPSKVLTTIDNILHAQEQFDDMEALIVEDSAYARQIVHAILTRHGLTIHEARDAQEALDLLQQPDQKIDIIITDYMMPGMSGEELCRQLRSLPALSQVPIFFISSDESKESVLKFFKSGANDYLPKPFTNEEFRARILTHLRNRKYVRELETLNHKLQFQADHDGLTGLYNRHFFQNALVPQFASHDRRGGTLCCLLLDLDHFKQVNDRYGHGFGDLVLKNFAKLLQEHFTRPTIPARYGGEEFAVLLPDTTMSLAMDQAKKLCRAAAVFPYSDGTTKIQVTVSIGVSSLRDHRPPNHDRLLVMADQALYQAKADGRNRVRAYTP